MTVQKPTEVAGLDNAHEEINRIIKRAIDSVMNGKMSVQKRADIIKDIKVLASIGFAAAFEKQSSQSTSNDLDNSASNKLYINSDGMIVSPKVTLEEQMQRNQSLIALLDKWAEEGDVEEQHETYDTMQYICDESGQKIAVVVPINIWQEIISEKETAYLLSNPTMRERLISAKNRQNRISLEEACEKVEPASLFGKQGNRIQVNSEGKYVLPSRTPEEFALQAQAVREMFAEWDQEYDAAEQRETLEFLQQALGENLLGEEPLSDSSLSLSP